MARTPRADTRARPPPGSLPRSTELRAVSHTHSPYATAWSFFGSVPLEPALENAGYLSIGDVATSVPAPTDSPEVAERAMAALRPSLAVLLSSLGVLDCGTTLAHALHAAEAMERQAHVARLLRADRDRCAYRLSRFETNA